MCFSYVIKKNAMFFWEILPNLQYLFYFGNFDTFLLSIN
jgi:hypothetical protein